MHTYVQNEKYHPYQLIKTSPVDGVAGATHQPNQTAKQQTSFVLFYLHSYYLYFCFCFVSFVVVRYFCLTLSICQTLLLLFDSHQQQRSSLCGIERLVVNTACPRYDEARTCAVCCIFHCLHCQVLLLPHEATCSCNESRHTQQKPKLIFVKRSTPFVLLL